MAKTKKASTESKGYVDFEFDVGAYTFTGRLYLGSVKEFGKVSVTPLSIAIDDLMTIKGCALKETESHTWIEFPTYKNKDNDFVSYVYVPKDNDTFTQLALKLAELEL